MRDRFNPVGDVTEETASRCLRGSATESVVKLCQEKLRMERRQVQRMIKDEIEALMKLGAEVTGMRYDDISTGVRRGCTTPKSMRVSYLQDNGDVNVKRVHWIFHELPLATHRDVLVQRRSHLDWVVWKIMHAMNVQWAPKQEGETSSHKNCIEHL